MNRIFDSHAHYDDTSFDEDRDALISSLAASGVCAVMNVGNSEEANLAGISLTERYRFFYCSVGIHPDQALAVLKPAGCEATGKPLDNEATALPSSLAHPPYLDLMAQQAHLPRVRAIGEIGLDYFYDEASPREIQRLVFEQQLALATSLDMPVIIHSRDAFQDTLDLLKKYKPKGVLHCFSGSAEEAKEAVKLGLYVGFTGVLTFKNARRALESAAQVPLSRLLVETDCPYMAPEPFRGKRCDSTMLTHTLEKLGEIKGLSTQNMADITFDNACELYNIRNPYSQFQQRPMF